MQLKKAGTLLLILFLAFQLRAQSFYDDVEVGLVTVSPGPAYYEAFGHSAIRIRSSQFDQTYGFGYFNFNDEDFFLNFLKGKMNYYLGIEDSEYEIQRYQYQGRDVRVQWLNLENSEKQSLLKELSHLARPENRSYNYDYFENNCTSRIRDLIEQHHGASLQSLSQIPQHSLYEEVFPVPNQSWLNLAFAIGFGMPAYTVKNEWQLMVFPKSFEEQLLRKDTDLQLVVSEEHWYEPNDEEIRELSYSHISTHAAVYLISLIALICMLAFKQKPWVHRFWWGLNSMIGLLLLGLWLLTEHKVAAWNFNLLLFIPFSFLLLKTSMQSSHTRMFFMFVSAVWLGLSLYFQNFYLLAFLLVSLISVFHLTAADKESS